MSEVAYDDCARAVLHDIGTIQPHGVLLAFDITSELVAATAGNPSALCGEEAAALIGRHWRDLAGTAPAAALFANGPAPHRQAWVVSSGTQRWFACGYRGRHHILLEFEPATDDPSFDSRDKIEFLDTVAGLPTPEAVAEHLLDHITAITGFDRTLLYHFLPDWHGQVLAERLAPGVESFLGLHFPAGDIPTNARRLYTVNLQRYIADTEATPLPVQGSLAAHTIDLSHAQLRAVHPVHLQYLRNMGVRSSFSVSLLDHGQLWGMIACHHRTTKHLAFAARLLCEELARIASLRISGLLALAAERRRNSLWHELEQAENLVRDSDEPQRGLVLGLDRLRRAFRADSVLLCDNDGIEARGAIRGQPGLARLASWLANQDAEETGYRDTIPSVLADDDAVRAHASGMLWFPLGPGQRLVLLRDEQIQELHWAGCPRPASAGDAFTPRASFARWVEETRGMAHPWLTQEREAADEFGESLRGLLEKQHLARMALEDALTGLANRRRFEQELQRAVDPDSPRVVAFAVHLLDLDRFKAVNDALGHDAGDELLRQVAARLQGLLREHDLVARLGGDEFAVLQCHFRDVADVQRVAGRIVEELRHPFTLPQGIAEIGVSVGIALHPLHGDDPVHLMKCADLALYAVKDSGRDAWRLWQGEIASAAS